MPWNNQGGGNNQGPWGGGPQGRGIRIPGALDKGLVNHDLLNLIK